MYDAKQFLSRVRLFDRKIFLKLKELQQIKDMITTITPAYSDNPGSGGSGSHDKIDKAICKIVDLQDEINSYVDQFVDARKDVLQILEKLDDPDQYSVLHERYVLYKTFEQIAEDLNFSPQWIFTIHGRALQKVNSLLKEQSKVDRS